MSNPKRSQTPHLNTGIDPKFNLAKFIPYDVSTENEKVVKYFPIAPLKEAQIVEFVIPNTGFLYTDFSRCSLQLKVKILKASGDPVTATELVSFSNMPYAGMFKQCDIHLNGVLMNAGVGVHHGYKVMIDNLVRGPKHWLESAGPNFMYYKDTAGAMDTIELSETPGTSGNLGLVKRWLRTKDGGVVEIQTPLMLDLCEMDQYLCSNVGVKITLYPQETGFTLMSKSTTQFYKYQIDTAVLHWQYIQPTTTIALRHSKQIATLGAYYSFPRSSIKSFSIPKSQKSWQIDSLFTEIPHTLYVCFVHSDAFSGSTKKNPWNFLPLDLTNITLYVEGCDQMTFEPNFTAEHYGLAFETLNRQNPIKSEIDFEDYDGGYAIYVFNIAKQHPRDAHGNLHPTTIQTRLQFNFGKELPHNVVAICYGRYDALLALDSGRNCYLLR